MAFKLIERNTVLVPVKGMVTDDAGKPERFDFTLLCKRLGADALRAQLQDKDRTVKEFMVDVTEGWRGVKDAQDVDLPFSESVLDQLLDISGMAQLAFDAYLVEQAAKAKN